LSRLELRFEASMRVTPPQRSALVVFVNFRVFSPESLVGLSLAFSPSVLGFPRTCGSSVSEASDHRISQSDQSILSCPSTPPQRLSSLRAASLPQNYADHSLASESSSRKLPSPSASLRCVRPSFHSSSGEAFSGLCSPTESPNLRVWLPSRRSQLLTHPRKHLSAPNALGLRPSKLSSSLVIQQKFPLVVPFLRFPAQPLGPASALQRLDPTKEAVPLYRSPGYSPRAGPRALLGFRPLGFSSCLASDRASPSLGPLSSFKPHLLTKIVLSDLKVFL